MADDQSIAEEWRFVRGYDGRYQVSNLGRVRRVVSKYGHRCDPKILRATPCVSRGGYLRIGLREDGRKRLHQVHRLVLEAFIGPPPFAGAQAAHLDNNPQNNDVRNLAWMSCRDNLRMRDAAGTAPKGERNNKAKLTNVSVQDIRRRRAAGESGASLAREYGVCKNTVWNIVHRQNWTHVA